MARPYSTNGIRALCCRFAAQIYAIRSGEKNIGVAILMPKKRTSIGIERDLCGLGIECKQKFARLVFRFGVCFEAVITLLGKLDVKSSVSKLSCPVCQLQNPDIWEMAARKVAAICTETVERQLTDIFDKCCCQPIFQ